MSRPAHSGTDVIDLTNDSDTPLRPSFSRSRSQATLGTTSITHEVIDLDDVSDHADGSDQPSDSPEIEVLYSQPRTGVRPRRSQSATSSRPRVPIPPPPSPPRASDFDYFANQQQVREVQSLQARQRARERARAREQAFSPGQGPHGTINNFFDNIPGLLRFSTLNNTIGQITGQLTGMVGQGWSNNQDYFTGPNFQAPELDFQTVAFDLAQPDRPPARAPPRYSAPQPVPEGFTRSPKEEDTVICPNCDAELGQGETEEKRQIWVVRSCGHVRDRNSIECFANLVRFTVANVQRTARRRMQKTARPKPSVNVLWMAVGIPS